MSPKKSQKTSKAVPMSRNMRSRTRLHKPRLVTDPAQSTLQLTNQLRALGLYAAPTLGDGNCLFRALADQLWGSPNDHLKLRAEICDWMEARKERYEGFVDEDRSFDTHIKCMRTPGTYGGHLELSAFAHLKRRNVKVIQPGLVYVIEWSCGWGADPSPSSSQASASAASFTVDESDNESGLNDREKRRLRRERKKEAKEREQTARRREAEEDDDVDGTERSIVAYVAYHDWEHFSSVRNLAGPHTGPPAVVEKPEHLGRARDTPPVSPTTPSSSPSKVKGKSRVPLHSTVSIPRRKTQSTAPPLPAEPARIPLPPSRSVSPTASSLSPPLSQASASTSATSSLAPLTPSDTSALAHNGRSPKRALDEADDPARRVIRTSKRRKGSDAMDIEVDAENTPSLSDASSSAFSSPSSSALSSPSPLPPDPPPEPQRPLTRRQRKALGLPKPRAVPLAGKTRSAGKIVVPGGKHSLRSTPVEGEWRTNGTGRLDVRGFRELKI